MTMGYWKAAEHALPFILREMRGQWETSEKPVQQSTEGAVALAVRAGC